MSRFPVLDVFVGGSGGIVVLKLILALIPVEILKEEKGVENENLLKERARGVHGSDKSSSSGIRQR